MRRLFLGGFVATALVTLVSYPLAQLVGLPQFDFAKGLIYGATSRDIPPFSTLWWVGLSAHFFNGTVAFPLLYRLIVPRLARGHFLYGAVWFAVGLWLLSQIVLMPLAGLGPFGVSAAEPALLGFVTFNAHLIYGVVLGIAAESAGKLPRLGSLERERRAA